MKNNISFQKLYLLDINSISNTISYFNENQKYYNCLQAEFELK